MILPRIFFPSLHLCKREAAASQSLLLTKHGISETLILYLAWVLSLYYFLKVKSKFKGCLWEEQKLGQRTKIALTEECIKGQPMCKNHRV